MVINIELNDFEKSEVEELAEIKGMSLDEFVYSLLKEAINKERELERAMYYYSRGYDFEMLTDHD